MDMFLEELDENRRIYDEACRKIEEENEIRFLNGQKLISEDPELPDSPDNVFYYLNFNGMESLKVYRRDMWRFRVPYIITTKYHHPFQRGLPNHNDYNNENHPLFSFHS